MSKRLVQYEFKVILQADEEAWPHEIRDELYEVVYAFSSAPILKVISVEQIKDNY